MEGCGFDFVDALYIENMGDDNSYTDGSFSHNMEFITHEAIRFIEDNDNVSSLLRFRLAVNFKCNPVNLIKSFNHLGEAFLPICESNSPTL